MSSWIVPLAALYFVFTVCQAVIVAIFTDWTTDFRFLLLSQGTVFVVLVVYGMVLLLRPEGVHSGRLVGLVVFTVIVSIVCHGLIYSKVGLVLTAVGKVIQPDLVDGL